jgi:hypothetical protein
MQLMPKLCICVVVLIAIASPAAANWQYTTWGMTPDQVTAAAHGNVLSVDPTTRNSMDGDQILLETPYSAGDFHFTADFGFDSTSRLDRVHLVLQSGDAVGLRAALQKKYGDPKHQDADFEAFGGRIIWITPDEQIVLWQMGSNSPGVTPNVTLEYTRIEKSSGEGL